MLYLLKRYFLKISQYYISTDTQVGEIKSLSFPWTTYLTAAFLLPWILIPDFVLRGIFYNFYLSFVQSFMDVWKLFELEDDPKLPQSPHRPLLAKIIGVPFVIFGWILGFLSTNLLTIVEAIYLNFYRAYLPVISEEQQKRINKLFKPLTVLGYLIGLLPAFTVGTIFLNIRLFLDGFIRGWNDTWFDSKQLRFKKFKNYVWLGFPGNVLAFIPRILVAGLFLSLRFIYSSTIGLYEGLNHGYQIVLGRKNKFNFRQDKLALLGKLTGFGVSYLLFKSFSLAGEVIVQSWQQFIRTIVFAHRLCFFDSYSVTLDDLGWKWSGLPGLMMGFIIGVFQSVFTLSFRLIQQLFITWLDFFISAYQDARKNSLNEGNAEFDPEQQEKTIFEKIFRWILGLFTLGFLVYIISYLFSWFFIVFIETTIRMFYFSIIYLIELAFWDKDVHMTNYPILASRDTVGWLGLIVGLTCGAVLAIALTLGRFIVESISGFILGSQGGEIDWQQKEKTRYQIVLSLAGYAIGRVLRAITLMPINFIYQAYKLVYLDDNNAWDINKNQQLKMSSLDYLMAAPFSGLPSALMFITFSVLLIGWRFIYESLLSLIHALPIATRFVTYYDENRSKTAQYGFGLPGIVLAYIPSVLMIMCAPMVAVYKWVSMSKSSRYENYQGHEEQLVKIKKLFGLLNNLDRSFDVSPDLNINNVATNNDGGKGSFCFIGKMLSFNQSSIAEQYMDEVLAKQKCKQDKLVINDFFKIKDTIKQKHSFWNKEQDNELEHTHQIVSQQLN